MNTPIPNLPSDVTLLQEMVLELSLGWQDKALEWSGRERKWQDEKQSLQRHADLLLEQVRLLRAKRFGPSSEKVRFEHPSLFDEAEQEALKTPDPEVVDQSELVDQGEQTVEVPAHTRRRVGRKPLPVDLPREEIIHDLSAEDKVCALDGHSLVEIGRETSEQLDIIPAQVKVIRHVRIKYACPHCRQGVNLAPMPSQPIPKSLASAGMLAFLAASKYADGLPLYRMESVLRRSGIELDRTVMAHWMIKAGNLVQPLINLLRDRMLDYGIIQMDETRVQVLKEPGRPATSQSFMWVQRGGPPGGRVILFDYDPSRSGQVPLNLLTGYEGWLQTDGYSGYSAVGASSRIESIGCWSHVRRKFDEAVKAAGKGKKPKAAEALGLIQKLYAIEKRCHNLEPNERAQVRQQEAPPIFEELRNWMSDMALKVIPGSATGRALAYLSGQWSRLIRYIEDGRLEIDNNSVENAIRPFVIGRKGWLFSNSVAGAKASANLYSLIETAKASGLEPYAYLRKVFSAIPNATTVEEFAALLPWNCKNPEKSKSLC